MANINVIPYGDANDNGGSEVQWRDGTGYIIVPNYEPAFFPHGDGFRMIFDGDNTRVEGDDGTVLWHCNSLTKNQETT
jgi:hypothetical protein